MAGRYRGEIKLGSDTTQRCRGRRKVCTGEARNKASWFPLVWLDKVCNQRYRAELTGPHKLLHKVVDKL